MSLFKFGPSGGIGGSWFDDVEAATNEFMSDPTVRIALIEVRHGARIDAIKVIYTQSGQTAFETAQHGGSGGTLDTLTLGENEEIAKLVVSPVYDGSRIGVSGLEFVTNQRVVAFGNMWPPQSVFSSLPGTHIIAFLGLSGTELDAVGVYLRTS